MKKCTLCNQLLQLTDFYIKDRSTGSLRTRCKSCVIYINAQWASKNRTSKTDSTKKWRIENRDKANELALASKRKNPNRTAWHSLKFSTRKKPQPLEINSAALMVFLKKPCHYCGRFRDPVNDLHSYWLDRADNSKGYTKGNILPCCISCNRIKGNKFTVDETKAMVKALLEYRKARDAL